MPSAALAVRPATPADIPALCVLKLKLLAAEKSLHVATASEDDWLRDGFGPAAKFTALVAERGGAIIGNVVGMATYSKRGFPGWRGTTLFMHDLYVEEAHRGHGCARALMAHLAAVAQSEGAAFIELTVDKSNDAREFYERLGFAHVSQCMSYVAAQPALQELAACSPVLPATLTSQAMKRHASR
jgi:GNAT superfamily N-acetyltransferase